MPAKTKTNQWYDVRCNLRGSTIRLITTTNNFLQISGVQLYTGRRGRRTTRTRTTSTTLYGMRLRPEWISQSSPYGNNRFPAANALRGKFTHTNKGVGMWW